jgi:hypothetical protein
VAIFQHSLSFLQSESFQTHVETIHRLAISPLAHHNGTSAYSPSLTCHLPAPTIECLHRPPYKLTCSSLNFPIRTQPSIQKESIARHTSTSVLERIPTHTRHISRCSNHRNARPLLRAQQCCLSTQLSANDAKAIKYCCVTKETQQCCSIPLL